MYLVTIEWEGAPGVLTTLFLQKMKCPSKKKRMSHNVVSETTDVARLVKSAASFRIRLVQISSCALQNKQSLQFLCFCNSGFLSALVVFSPMEQ